MKEFNRQRAARNNEQIMQAAIEQFCRKGYYAVSVEDIAKAAGVSRMTFYRHFRSRAQILTAIFQQGREENKPGLIEIRDRDFRDFAVVRAWVQARFDKGRARSELLRAFAQATKIDAEFLEEAQKLIAELIEELGETIPAFKVDRTAGPDAEYRWLEGWLILYDIFDQGNQAALDMGVANNPMVVDILTRRFVDFVNKY